MKRDFFTIPLYLGNELIIDNFAGGEQGSWPADPRTGDGRLCRIRAGDRMSYLHTPAIHSMHRIQSTTVGAAAAIALTSDAIAAHIVHQADFSDASADLRETFAASHAAKSASSDVLRCCSANTACSPRLKRLIHSCSAAHSSCDLAPVFDNASARDIPCVSHSAIKAAILSTLIVNQYQKDILA